MPRRARTEYEKKSAAGRKGGLATLERYGTGHFSEMAGSRKRHGGPERRATLEELQAVQAEAAGRSYEGSLSDLPNDMRELTRLVFAKYRKGAAGSVAGAGAPGRFPTGRDLPD